MSTLAFGMQGLFLRGWNTDVAYDLPWSFCDGMDFRLQEIKSTGSQVENKAYLKLGCRVEHCVLCKELFLALHWLTHILRVD
jgi:hypothetical protein